MNIYCNNTWKAVVGMLKTNEYSGLNDLECEERRKNHGGNRVFIPYKKNIFKTMKSFFSLHMFFSIIVILFLMYSKQYSLGGIALVVFLLTMILKAIHSRNIVNRAKFMEKLNDSTCRVLRNGVEKIVKSEEIVKGDIVLFSKDSLIPADLRIIRAEDLKVDEKNITGEKFFKDKFDSKIDSNVDSIEEMKNMLFKGSIIKSGQGSGVVVETGNSTYLGKTLVLMTSADNNKHTLGKKLEKKLNSLMCASLVIAILASIVSMYFTNNDTVLYLSLFLTQVIPVTIIVFSFIAFLRREFKKKGIDLINISALDMINEVNILFMDKVGSITKEEMIIEKIYINNKVHDAHKIIFSKEVTLRRLIEGILLCNNAEYDDKNDKIKGDLADAAYVKFAYEKGIRKFDIEELNRRIFEIPMDSDKRMLTTINRAKKGCRANCKGNVEAVLSRCKYIMVDGLQKELTGEDIARIKAIDYNLSLEGYITQGVAYRNFSYIPTMEENIENNLVFTGIVALNNPLSDELNEEIESIKSRGIIPIIFTDDNKITATTIGRKAKLISSNSRVIAGVELQSLGREELIDTVSRTRVFSRVSPELRARIVGLFVKENYKVASFGECLGDLPSMCISKLGISKGNAAQIIRNASDLFIQNNFLKGFLSVFDMSDKFADGIEKFKSFIFGIVISQIIALNIVSIINKQFTLGLAPILIFNIFIISPLSLIVLSSSKDSIVKVLSRVMLYICLTIGGLYSFNGGFDVLWLLLFGVYAVVHCIINCNIGIKEKSLKVVFLLSAIVFLIIGVLALISISGYAFTTVEISKIAGVVLLDIVCEFILKKWQE